VPLHFYKDNNFFLSFDSFHLKKNKHRFNFSSVLFIPRFLIDDYAAQRNNYQLKMRTQPKGESFHFNTSVQLSGRASAGPKEVDSNMNLVRCLDVEYTKVAIKISMEQSGMSTTNKTCSRLR